MTCRAEIKTWFSRFIPCLKNNGIFAYVNSRYSWQVTGVDKTGHLCVKIGGTDWARSSYVYLSKPSCANASGQVHYVAWSGSSCTLRRMDKCLFNWLVGCLLDGQYTCVVWKVRWVVIATFRTLKSAETRAKLWLLNKLWWTWINSCFEVIKIKVFLLSVYGACNRDEIFYANRYFTK